jgi:succinyl-CoA synthetase beta subunit
MNVHEYQAKQLLGQRGVTVPPGGVASTPEEAATVAKRLFAEGHAKVVVKSQVHAGGRGKGKFQNGFQGGVQLAASATAVSRLVGAMLNQVLVTQQTGLDGRMVRRLLIEAAGTIRKEFYLAVTLDRASARPAILASTEGGMDIEEVAARAPEKILRAQVDPAIGLMPYQARGLAVALGLTGDLINAAARLIQGAYRTWWECDASLVEVNPLALVEGPNGKLTLCAIDAKINLDDNSLSRHPELQALRDLGEEAALELEAGKHELNYIQLDGNIACLVNGAGLAMATMDIIQHYGGRPANFLDVGGGANAEQVAAAFRIILQDPNVRAILVNIFGGIMDCDVIARGLVTAARETGLKLPLVVRLEGNNVLVGRQTLAASGLSMLHGDSMADAAQKAVAAAA